jgi:chemotaxis protein CheX
MSLIEEPPPPAAPPSPAPPRSLAELIASFVKSTADVLATMANIKVAIGKPTFKSDPATLYEVSGIIGFSGAFKGSMVLSFQKRTALAVVTAFAGTPIQENSADFADAIGELANMVAGAAKSAFGPGTAISVPSVVMGAGHCVAALHDVPCVVIPCKTASGDFAVEVNIKAPGALPGPKGSA